MLHPAAEMSYASERADNEQGLAPDDDHRRRDEEHQQHGHRRAERRVLRGVELAGDEPADRAPRAPPSTRR